MDDVRRGYHKKLQIMNEAQKAQTKIIKEYLFNEKALAMRPGNDDGMAFENDQPKAMNVQAFDYQVWREELIPSL